MKNDKTYLKHISGHDIWITVMRPYIVDQQHSSNAHESLKHCCAFRIDEPPLIIDGEFLRNDQGHLRWFDQESDAVDEAIIAANTKLSQ